MIPRATYYANGGLLGLLNTLFISIGVGWHESLLVAFCVFLFGMIPGLVIGKVLEALAKATARSNVWWRRLLIGVPAIGGLLGMAATFGVEEFLLPAVIPTIVCALILERNTRYIAAAPVARATFRVALCDEHRAEAFGSQRPAQSR